MTSLLLCDDHPLILQGFSALLRDSKDFHIVATVSDGSEALRALRDTMPDIALLDISVPHFDGLSLLRMICREGWPIRVILLTASISDAQIVEAIAAGAAGILLKDAAPATLLHCLKMVARGERWLPPDLVRPALRRQSTNAMPCSPLALLTPREYDVAELVAESYSNKEIAAALRLSEGTVKIHLHSIYSKLGVDNRTAVAIMYARRAGNGTVPTP
jgi:DNA-binding NarL/FixJ family response regulator